MSHRELTRCEVVKAVLTRSLTQREAAARLALSGRQVKRLVRAYRNAGPRGLLSRRRARPANRRIAAAEQTRCIELVRQRYADFGPTLAAEYLAAQHGYTHSVETLRGWMIAAGLWQPAKGARQRPHPPRERRARRGVLPMREDAVTEADRHADYQRIAPAVEDGLYLVPRVVE